jgi:hypothetical protein
MAQQVDPAAIAQSGIDPISGSPLSAEQRKALFKRAVAPSSILGKGGALVKRTDSGTSLVVAQTQQITSLQDQLNVLRVEVAVLNNGLKNIGNIIQQDSVLEQQRLKGEQEQERKNLEQEVRLGKENELERKIQSALMKPVVALQNKVTNIFSNIFGALGTLFAGWLTNQGIETLKALDEGNKDKLNQIKDTVLKNIAYAIGGIAAIKIGFGLIIRSVIGLTARIGAIAVRLALAPFRFLGSQLAKVPVIGKLFGAGAKKPPSVPRGRVPVTGGNWMTRMGNFFRGAGPATRGATAAASAGKGLGRFVPGLNVVLGGAATAYDVSQKDYFGAALSATSMVPGPIGWIGAASRLGYGLLKGENGQPQIQPQEQALPSENQRQQPPTPAATPQESMMPQASELSLTPQNQERQGINEFQQEAGKDLVDVNVDAKTAYTMPSLISSAQMQTIPNQQPGIGALPEPEANVVMLPAPQSQKRQSMISPSSAGSDVPLINSANPDNFYVLYSQLNYNVVM